MQDHSEKENHRLHDQLMGQKRDLNQKSLHMVWHMLLMIAVPAFTALFIGKKFILGRGLPKVYIMPLFIVAIVLSWVMILRSYQKHSDKHAQIDSELKRLKHL